MAIQINQAGIPKSYLDTDGTMAANSDAKVPSQKAVVTYVAATAGSSEHYETYTATATAKDVVYMTAAGTAARAKADSSTTVYAIGFATETKTAAACIIQTAGVITITGKTFTPGLPVYISPTTAGDCTQTPPSTVGHQAQIVGIALTATDVEINIGPVVEVGTGIATPAEGGTGVANNAASTLTISGNYATTLTVSDTTGVTLPTTGTLATVQGVQAGTGTYFTSAGGTTAYTLTPTPAIAAYAAGQRWSVFVNATNTGASTLAISGLAARNIYKINNAGTPVAIVAGDLIINTIARLIDDGTQLILLNPPVRDTSLVLTDVTTGNASTSSHGLQMKCTTANQALGTGDSPNFANPTVTTLYANTVQTGNAASVAKGSNHAFYCWGTLNTYSSGTTIVWASAIAANAIVYAVTTRVVTTLTGSGVTAYTVGDGTTPDIWGIATDKAAGTTTSIGQYPVATVAPKYYGAGTNIVITGVGGNLTGGSVRIVLFYAIVTPPTSS